MAGVVMIKKTVDNLLYFLWQKKIDLRLGEKGELIVSPRSEIDASTAAAIFMHKPVIVEALRIAGPTRHIDLMDLMEAKRRVFGPAFGHGR